MPNLCLKLSHPVGACSTGRAARGAWSSLESSSHRIPFIVAELGADIDPFMLHIYAS
jgi:hypothetical protein